MKKTLLTVLFGLGGLAALYTIAQLLMIAAIKFGWMFWL